MVTQEQFGDFVRRLYCAFPSIMEYNRFNSLDVEVTHAVWFEQLHKFEISELNAVLADWVRASSEPFTTGQRGMIGILIRAKILGHRDRLAKIKRDQEEAAKFERGKSRRAGYRGVGLEKLFDIGRRASKLLERGEITESQWEEIRDDLAKQAGYSGNFDLVDPIDRIMSQCDPDQSQPSSSESSSTSEPASWSTMEDIPWLRQSV